MTETLPVSGKEAATQSFEESYERYSQMLYRVCMTYLKNPADAEDAVADVFVKLMSHKTGFQSAEHEKAWLLRAAINRCKDILKHASRKNESLESCESLLGAESPDTDETLRLVLKLPQRYKAAVYLYYYEGYSGAEIAGMLKKPRSTVLNHLHEARILLKGVLENEK